MFSTAPSIKLIIADDHALIRAGFASYLHKQTGLQLVAEAANGKELLSLTERHNPDIIFTDISMPEMDGIEATRIITEKYPHIAVIALTIMQQDYIITDMLSAGAKGFLLKHVHPSELLKAILAVHNNENYYCRHTTEKLNRLILNKEFDPVTKERKLLLSPRETEVLLLICKEKTNKDISEILHISVRTVECFRSNLQRKTGVLNIAGMIKYAVKHGIYKVENND